MFADRISPPPAARRRMQRKSPPSSCAWISPGGSPTAAEAIRRAVVYTKRDKIIVQ
ncbi:MAG: hypothetical protein HND56_12830 [Pseudomonadota bacterium]|nr:MAG: hypothetical protein HND56_12830 [Pseudomonadota bacterium]